MMLSDVKFRTGYSPSRIAAVLLQFRGIGHSGEKPNGYWTLVLPQVRLQPSVEIKEKAAKNSKGKRLLLYGIITLKER